MSQPYEPLGLFLDRESDGSAERVDRRKGKSLKRCRANERFEERDHQKRVHLRILKVRRAARIKPADLPVS